MPNWYPGQVALGAKIEPTVVGMTQGFWTQPPAVTSPGTIGSGTAVANSTGLDCMVYASATTGISKILVGAGTVTAGGTVAPAQVLSVYVPAGQSITVTYTGNLTWKWLAV